MGNPSLEKMILQKYQNVADHIAEKIAPEVNQLFKESVEKSLINYYDSYSPDWYKRTNNFMSVGESSTTTGKGNVIEMYVDHSPMHDYPGFNGKKPLPSADAFDMFFDYGNHGHGYWLKAISTPPQQLGQKDIDSGFNGKIQKILRDTFKNIK